MNTAVAVLVIDDELFIREAVQDILDFSGIHAYSAANGREGIMQFAQHRDTIKTILLDMKMPEMDGAATLQGLRALDPTIKIILCSGLDEPAALIAAGDPALYFLPKPYTMDALLELVQKTLA